MKLEPFFLKHAGGTFLNGTYREIDIVRDIDIDIDKFICMYVCTYVRPCCKLCGKH